MIITDRTDIDPANRRFFSAEYDGSNYWVRSVKDINNWLVIKDDVDNGEYNTYNVRNRGHKFICSCPGSMHGKRGCRHIDIVREVMKNL